MDTITKILENCDTNISEQALLFWKALIEKYPLILLPKVYTGDKIRQCISFEWTLEYDHHTDRVISYIFANSAGNVFMSFMDFDKGNTEFQLPNQLNESVNCVSKRLDLTE